MPSRKREKESDDLMLQTGRLPVPGARAVSAWSKEEPRSDRTTGTSAVTCRMGVLLSEARFAVSVAFIAVLVSECWYGDVAGPDAACLWGPVCRRCAQV